MTDARARITDYERTRGRLLLVGLIILTGMALIMYVRRVDPTEVAATLFFLPIFMAFLYFGTRGGIVVGVLAAIGYVALRIPAVEAVGLERFLGTMISRTVGYLAFGGFGGWAAQQLGTRLTKLDQYDEVDDETRLSNSRGFVETIIRERARARRYDEVFSVVMLECRLDHLERRSRAAVLDELGRAIQRRVRAVDYAFHAVEGGTDLFAALLPETGPSGAATFSVGFTHVVEDILVRHGAVAGTLIATTASFPDDESIIDTVLARAERIFTADFPAASLAE